VLFVSPVVNQDTTNQRDHFSPSILSDMFHLEDLG
jgi:hypothetical protein